MSVGLSPKYQRELLLYKLDNDRFQVIAIKVILRLGWHLSFVSKTGMTAYVLSKKNRLTEKITITNESGIATVYSECLGSQYYDYGRNKKNIEAFLSDFETIKNCALNDNIEEGFTFLNTVRVHDEEDVLQYYLSEKNKNKTISLKKILLSKQYRATLFLIAINLLIFGAMVFSGVNFFMPSTEDMLRWGANFQPRTLDGQWWRIFTSLFIHMGIIHLIANMFALLYIGLLLEPFTGSARLVMAYLFAGIMASTFSLYWNEFMISSGASGAIFGMYGVFIALLSIRVFDKAINLIFLISILLFVSYSLLSGFMQKGGVDNAAHAGGFFCGILIGYAFVPGLTTHSANFKKKLPLVVLIAIGIVTVVFCFKLLPNDYRKYEEDMKEFSLFEQRALSIYYLPHHASSEEKLITIREKGIPGWEKCLEIINNASGLRLPAKLRNRNIKLKEYCTLRIKTYKLIYKGIQENSNKYVNEIYAYKQKIQQIIISMNNN